MGPINEDFDSVELVRELAATLIPMILSLSVHECAHAWTAYRFGDTTAKDEGRLTLDPRSHVDPVGTLLVPAISVMIGGLGLIAWAKPAPFRADRIRPGVSPRLALAVVSAAGPLANLAIAFMTAALLAVLVHLERWAAPTSIGRTIFAHHGAISALLTTTFKLNIALAVFNLIPIPPLDGHRLLPPFFDRFLHPLRRYGFALLLAIFMLLPQVANFIFYRPVIFVAHRIAMLFGLA